MSLSHVVACHQTEKQSPLKLDSQNARDLCLHYPLCPTTSRQFPLQLITPFALEAQVVIPRQDPQLFH